MTKKKNISATEYVEIEQGKDQTRNTIVSQRCCTIDKGIYMIFDYYKEVDGSPLTCIVSVDEGMN
jgi:hypothetical protein